MAILLGCNCRYCREDRERDEVYTGPTERVVKTNTRTRRVKHIHPTEVINVNRTVVRNEHYYPVTERDVYETIEEDFNCGSDVNNSRCRPFWT